MQVDKLKVLSESLVSSASKAEKRISDTRFVSWPQLGIRMPHHCFSKISDMAFPSHSTASCLYIFIESNFIAVLIKTFHLSSQIEMLLSKGVKCVLYVLFIVHAEHRKKKL